MKSHDQSCSVQRILHYDTGLVAPMNSAVVADEKNYTLVVGVNDSSQLYTLRHKIITPKKDGEGMRTWRFV